MEYVYAASIAAGVLLMTWITYQVGYQDGFRMGQLSKQD